MYESRHYGTQMGRTERPIQGLSSWAPATPSRVYGSAVVFSINSLTCAYVGMCHFPPHLLRATSSQSSSTVL